MSISCLAAFFVGDEDVTLFAVSLNQAVHTSYSAVHPKSGSTHKLQRGAS